MSYKTSHTHVNTTIYVMILIIGALFIPLQFGYANTNTSNDYLQRVISHICDQTISTTNILPYQGYTVGGCSVGGSYRAVQATTDEQQTTDDTNSNTTSRAGLARALPYTQGFDEDRRH